MQAMRIIEARDHIARAAYAAMRRVEAEAALSQAVARTARQDQPQPGWREAGWAPLRGISSMGGSRVPRR